MTRSILTHGIISGVIITGSILLSLTLGGGDSNHVASLEWLGYLVMLLALSIIFVAIKRYRDQELGGVIKVGTALKLGVGISLVASAVYVGVWEIHLAMTDYAFIHEYAASAVQAKQEAGVTGEELEAFRAELEAMKVQYDNPLYRLPITFSEIFPVGLLVALVSAFVLRNPRILPASTGGAATAA